jgi:1-acyl-sn-glycerol-3-phosphate acyltransferase
MIFPEGHRTRTGKMGPFNEWIGHLAIDIGAPIVLVRLSGAFELLPPYASYPKRGDVSAHIGSKPYFAKGAPPKGCR